MHIILKLLKISNKVLKVSRGKNTFYSEQHCSRLLQTSCQNLYKPAQEEQKGKRQNKLQLRILCRVEILKV